MCELLDLLNVVQLRDVSSFVVSSKITANKQTNAYLVSSFASFACIVYSSARARTDLVICDAIIDRFISLESTLMQCCVLVIVSYMGGLTIGSGDGTYPHFSKKLGCKG